MKRVQSILSILVLTAFFMATFGSAPHAHAATATINSIHRVYTSDRCSTIDEVQAYVTYEGTTEDNPLTRGDYITFVVYDGTGTAFMLYSYHTLVNSELTDRIEIDHQINGGAVSAGPFTLTIYDVTSPPSTVAEAETAPILDSTTFDPASIIGGSSCTFSNQATTGSAADGDIVEVPVPGCDVFMTIPDTAASGLFVANTPLLWGPNSAAATGLNVEAGKTYLVLGTDNTAAYYQILMQCQRVWVSADAVRPNPDAVWGNAPLPVNVID